MYALYRYTKAHLEHFSCAVCDAYRLICRARQVDFPVFRLVARFTETMTTLERLNTDIGAAKRGASKGGNWGRIGGVARRLLVGGARKTRPSDVIITSAMLDGGRTDPIVSQTVSSVGLTEKERQRYDIERLASDVEVFNVATTNCSSSRHWCERCEERRTKLARLQREIDRMRHLIINDDIVTLEAPANSVVSPEVLELAQESAKLRITIDSLMRFQVRCAVCGVSRLLTCGVS